MSVGCAKMKDGTKPAQSTSEKRHLRSHGENDNTAMIEHWLATLVPLDCQRPDNGEMKGRFAG
jgi:hypothetical protein